MISLEIENKLSKDGNLLLPEEVKKEINSAKRIKLIILDEDDENENIAWENNTVSQFIDGYSKKDAIYDKL